MAVSPSKWSTCALARAVSHRRESSRRRLFLLSFVFLFGSSRSHNTLVLAFVDWGSLGQRKNVAILWPLNWSRCSLGGVTLCRGDASQEAACVSNSRF